MELQNKASHNIGRLAGESSAIEILSSQNRSATGDRPMKFRRTASASSEVVAIQILSATPHSASLSVAGECDNGRLIDSFGCTGVLV